MYLKILEPYYILVVYFVIFFHIYALFVVHIYLICCYKSTHIESLVLYVVLRSNPRYLYILITHHTTDKCFQLEWLLNLALVKEITIK